jgi:enolase-phosphatase E1
MTITGILLDIEGTTTPIDFVYKVLFPYARTHMKAFLGEHLSDEEIRACLASLREEHAADEQQGFDPPPLQDQPKEVQLDSIVSYIHWLMDRDRKSTPLKSIQGRVWQHGYRIGELRSQVFGDVPAAFERWHKHNRQIRIFSSGSVLAQKLLFANTEAGDLTKFIGGYFDTKIGAKGDAESYKRISNAFGLAASQIVFISDVTEELDGARSANMQTRLCLRPGNRPQPLESKHATIRSFDELFPVQSQEETDSDLLGHKSVT